MAKKIKVKGKCPICGNKMIWGSNEYYEEPWTREYLPICTNNDCDLSVGYGSDIKFRFINHRTVKIVYDEGYRRELIIVETDNIGQNIHHAYKAVLSSNRESSVQQFLSKYIEALKEPESDNDKLLILDSAPKFIKGTHAEVRFNELMKDCIEDITDKSSSLFINLSDENKIKDAYIGTLIDIESPKINDNKELTIKFRCHPEMKPYIDNIKSRIEEYYEKKIYEILADAYFATINKTN